MKTLITILLLLVINLGSYAQGYFNHPLKVWDFNNHGRILDGNTDISRADENAEKVFFSIGKGENIPEKVWSLHKLKVLKISMAMNSCCPIVGNISEKLNDLSNLEYIFFEGIGVESLPNDLGNLTKLRSFSLSEAPAVDAHLKRLPDFNKLPAIEIIYVTLNKKTDLSLTENYKTIFEKNTLKALALNSSMLTTASLQPIEILKNLEILELENNQLNKIPNIFLNKSLKQLSIRQNQLEIVDEGIGELAELTALNLSYNKLKLIPEQLGNLKKLKYLNLDENDLSELPQSFSSLNQLEVLTLRGNEISKIPDAIYNLKNLKQLDVMQTNITTIDKRILDTNIEVLRISNKEAGKFNFDPKMLAQLKTLKTFQISSSKADKDVLNNKDKLKKLRPDIR